MTSASGGGVVFDYSGWIARYPEFVTVLQPLAQLYFNEATLYCDNSSTSIINNDNGQLVLLLNMMTAHIAAMNALINNQAASPLVGRIATATEGTVTVQTDNQYPPGTVQWFQQTKYGAAYWAATAKYRTMHYVVGPRRRANPFGPIL